MSHATTIQGRVNEDGTASCLGRLVGIQGTGTQITGDVGKPFKQADISTVTAKVYELGTNPNATSGTEVTPAPTYTVAGVIYDTLQTVGWDTAKDADGYNFRADVAATFFTTAGYYYQVEFKFTLTGGAVVWARYKVLAVGVLTS